MDPKIGKANREGRLRRRFDRDGGRAIEAPAKLGSPAAARIEHGRESGCDVCFPHGFETKNASRKKNERSWKRSRKTPHRA